MRKIELLKPRVRQLAGNLIKNAKKMELIFPYIKPIER